MFDATRGLYRLISVDPTCKNVIVNSTIVKELDFHKTSQRFGHWTDLATGVVFGIGFKSEQQLEDFADCVRKAKVAVSGGSGGLNKATTLQPPRNNMDPDFRELFGRLGLKTEPIENASLAKALAQLGGKIEEKKRINFDLQGECDLLRNVYLTQNNNNLDHKHAALLGEKARLEKIVRSGEVNQGQGDPMTFDYTKKQLEDHYKVLLDKANRELSAALEENMAGKDRVQEVDALFCKAIHELTGIHRMIGGAFGGSARGTAAE
ncbi:Homer protein 2 [Folsomia candida]|uniref:Homer protein 2 n=1 Tax=Folsomia candida TaxID=158441 RepID=A0A226EGQ4_FOLCA|nr:Homer protein 2 [Folsomia candida]